MRGTGGRPWRSPSRYSDGDVRSTDSPVPPNSSRSPTGPFLRHPEHELLHHRPDLDVHELDPHTERVAVIGELRRRRVAVSVEQLERARHRAEVVRVRDERVGEEPDV